MNSPSPHFHTLRQEGAVIIRLGPEFELRSLLRQRPLLPDLKNVLMWSAIWLGAGIMGVILILTKMFHGEAGDIGMASGGLLAASALSCSSGIFYYWKKYRSWEVRISKVHSLAGLVELQVRFAGVKLRNPRAMHLEQRCLTSPPGSSDGDVSSYWSELTLKPQSGDPSSELCIKTIPTENVELARLQGCWLRDFFMGELKLPEQH